MTAPLTLVGSMPKRTAAALAVRQRSSRRRGMRTWRADVGAERFRQAGAADRVDAQAPAPEVVLLLAVSVERDLQRGCLGFHVTGLEAGEGGIVQGFLPGLIRRCRLRRRARGRGMRSRV